MYQGTLIGGEVKSSEIKFEAGKFKSGTYVADTKTAGSLCLLLQVALPCAIFGSLDGSLTRIKFCGGSNATMAPQIDYFLRVFHPIASRFGFPEMDVRLVRRGFYPQGRGIVEFSCNSLPAGQPLRPLIMEKQGDIVEIFIMALTAGNESEEVAENAAQTAKQILDDFFPDPPIRVAVTRETRDTAWGNGAAINIIATTTTGAILAGSALLEKGKGGHEMGSAAASQLISNIKLGGALDEYAQDQMIIFMALAAGRSKVKVGPLQLHTETSIHIASTLTSAKFTVTAVEPDDYERPDTEQSYYIECEGIGFNSEASGLSAATSSSSSRSKSKKK